MMVSPTVEERLWNEERYGWDVSGPCWECGSPIRYFVDEDGTPRDIEPAAKEHGLVVTASEDGELDVERLRAAIISSSALFHGNPKPDREQTLATIAAKDIAREYERLRR